VTQTSPNAHTPVSPALLNDKEIEAYTEYQALFNVQQELKQLISQAPQLDDTTQAARILALQKELAKLKQAGKVSQPEALFLQLALLKITPDSEHAKAQAKKLIANYQQVANERHQAFVNNPSSDQIEYKQQERLIVQEVLAMNSFPNGLSRDEYLAKRLNNARLKAYASMENE
jgi:hypothetical protein